MTPAEREAAILSLEPDVRCIAIRRLNLLSSQASLDELVSAGWLGAIKAVDSFDAARGLTLGTYARWRINGEIGDYLRSIDPLSRAHRRHVSSGECDAPVTLSLESVRHSSRGEEIPLFVEDPHGCQEQRRIDARITLRRIYARAGLRPRNAKVLKLYMEGETMKQIGRSFGVNESRVSQICSDAIQKLRAAA